MARSRRASGELRRAGCSRSSSISCTVRGFGSVLPTFGEARLSVGLIFTLPSAWRNAKNDLTAATLRATVASAYDWDFRLRMYSMMLFWLIEPQGIEFVPLVPFFLALR